MHLPHSRILLLLCVLAVVAAACGAAEPAVVSAPHDGAAVGEASPEGNEADDPGTNIAQVADGAASTGNEAADRTNVVLGANWSDAVTITLDGLTVNFASNGLPDHEVADVYLGDGPDGKFVASGATSYDAQFSFPLIPTMADSPTDSPGGPIGVAVSGAVFFDPFEGDGSNRTANDDNEIIDGVPFIDACGGHPLPDGSSYHYHGIPFCITDALDTELQHSPIIGYLFDGYAIHGPQEVGGAAPTDLDECLGHVGPTQEFAEDTYHYHVTEDANYISSCFTGVATANSSGN